MKRPVRFLAIAVLLSVCASLARADEVDDCVTKALAEQRIPGVAIAVVKDGQVVRSGGYGLANVELNVPVTPQTVFQIGSISKQFLAAGIMLLVQDGKLQVDDKISRYLQDTPESWRDISIRHLLTHTSGILRDNSGFDMFRPKSDADVMRALFEFPLRAEPGARHEYSNSGYLVAAEIIRQVSGRPWHEFLQQRIFEPLGMSTTCPLNFHEVIPNRANSYDSPSPGRIRNVPSYISIPPAGAYLSTVLDMAKWDLALYGDSVLTRASRDAMFKPATLTDGATVPYGFGWRLSGGEGHQIVEHGGSISGFRASMERHVDDKLAVIVLANGASANPGAISRNIAKLYLSDPSSKPGNHPE